MEFKPVKRANMSDQVFEQLKQKVIEGEWAQGHKLPSENDLAENFQVSRVTIRHAIHKLVALGLAETKLGEGTFIRELNPGIMMQAMIPVAYLSPRDTMEVLDFRYILEIETTGMAVERCTQEDIGLLEQQLQVMLGAKGDYWAFSDADLDFHMLIARITRNSLIIETYSILRDILEVCMKKTVSSLGVEIGIPYHRSIIEAFKNHNPKQAKDVMRNHMASTRREFEQALKQQRTAMPDDEQS